MGNKNDESTASLSSLDDSNSDSDCADFGVSVTIPKKSCMKVSTLDESLRTKGIVRKSMNTYEIPSSVQFGKVEVRSYPRILGDHPRAKVGPAITLGWEFDEENFFMYDLDQYENAVLCTGGRRTRKQMIVPPQIRIQWCLDAGHSIEGIRNSIKQCRREREERKLKSTVESITSSILSGTRRRRSSLHSHYHLRSF